MNTYIKIIVLLSLPFFLFAESTLLDSLKLLKTSEQNLTLENVQKKDNLFKKIEENEHLDNRHMTYWLRLELNASIESGEYIIRYAPMDFDVHSFPSVQKMKRLLQTGFSKKLSFEYEHHRDSRIYYFRLLPLDKSLMDYRIGFFFNIKTKKASEKAGIEYLYYLLFCGFVLGIIFMAGLYNGAIYYYNREIAFFYYAFMQFFMVGILSFSTGLFSLNVLQMFFYDLLSLFTAFFATLFTRAFFNTKEYLPHLDKALLLYLFLLCFDIIYILSGEASLVGCFRLYSVFGLLYLVVGFLRWREGFQPAKFFLIGWGALILSLVLVEYFERLIGVNPLLLGSPIEAILLAVGLAYKIRLIQEEKEQQKEMLVHQSKLASMGEMIGNIAHQWRQPLNYLSYSFMNLKEAYRHNELDEVYLNKKVEEANKQLVFMSQTINDFRDFYAPTKQKESFSILEETQKSLEIMHHALKKQDIEWEIIVEESLELVNYKNEYKQVLVNLLSNAKDVLVSRVILSPKITIVIQGKKILIKDNAGGIKKEIMAKIFEPYFTTKEGNSGIGLYMSKMIIERNMGGCLSVKNGEKGAVFTIEL